MEIVHFGANLGVGAVNLHRCGAVDDRRAARPARLKTRVYQRISFVGRVIFEMMQDPAARRHEPPRQPRRLFGMSQAAIAVSFIAS